LGQPADVVDVRGVPGQRRGALVTGQNIAAGRRVF